jgi:protein involved in polysaccharide export with SLBB domain
MVKRLLLLPIVLMAFSITQADGDSPSTHTSGRMLIGGSVPRPGSYPLMDVNATVLGAIRIAGGAEGAKDYEIRVARHIQGNLLETFEFNSLAALEQAPDADLTIRANDVVYVIPIK